MTINENKWDNRAIIIWRYHQLGDLQLEIILKFGSHLAGWRSPWGIPLRSLDCWPGSDCVARHFWGGDKWVLAGGTKAVLPFCLRIIAKMCKTCKSRKPQKKGSNMGDKHPYCQLFPCFVWTRTMFLLARFVIEISWMLLQPHHNLDPGRTVNLPEGIDSRPWTYQCLSGNSSSNSQATAGLLQPPPRLQFACCL